MMGSTGWYEKISDMWSHLTAGLKSGSRNCTASGKSCRAKEGKTSEEQCVTGEELGSNAGDSDTRTSGEISASGGQIDSQNKASLIQYDLFEIVAVEVCIFASSFLCYDCDANMIWWVRFSLHKFVIVSVVKLRNWNKNLFRKIINLSLC